MPLVANEPMALRFNNAVPSRRLLSRSDELSDADLAILRRIPRVKRVEDLAKALDMSPATLGREIARLQIAGYLAHDGTLTEKGLDAAKDR